MNKLVVSLLVAGGCLTVAEAKVEFGTPFADGMVLQREMKVPVWGTAPAGEKVAVRFSNHLAKVVADKDGKWMVTLPSMKASKTPRVLSAMDRDGEVQVKDVLVGEVWYVCGQSNTELPLWSSMPRFRDGRGALVAQLAERPNIRFCYAANYRWSTKSKAKAAYAVKWQAFSNETLGKGHGFSAMGVYFALNLYGSLDIPIGLVGSYWGGTGIDPWTPACGYESRADLKDVAALPRLEADAFKKAREKGGVYDEKILGASCFRDPWQQPSVLWNEQVAPWCPMAMRGFIWYQGCHNAGEWRRYCSKMHALYDGWAKMFKNPELKLYFAQLCSWGGNIAPMQEAQTQFAVEEKNAGIAVINDVGNLRDIHPNDKLTVGLRMAALALKHAYGFNIKADSPTFKSWKIDGDTVELTFDNAEGWYVYNPDRSFANGFELCGEDGVWKKAEFVNIKTTKNWKGQPEQTGGLVGSKVVLKAKDVTAPKKLRYLYSAPWFGSLYNEVGLPLGAFHIGD